MADVLIRREKTQREHSHVPTEAVTEEMELKAEDPRGCLQPSEARREAVKPPPLQVPGRARPCGDTFDFELLAFRSERQYVCVFQSTQFVIVFTEHSQETNTQL